MEKTLELPPSAAALLLAFLGACGGRGEVCEGWAKGSMGQSLLLSGDNGLDSGFFGSFF